MRTTSLQLQQFNKPSKTTYQVLLGKLATPVQAAKDGIPLSCYCWAIKGQVLSSLLLLITPSTERILLKDTNSLLMNGEYTLDQNNCLDKQCTTYKIDLNNMDLLWMHQGLTAQQHSQLMTMIPQYAVERVLRPGSDGRGSGLFGTGRLQCCQVVLSDSIIHSVHINRF
ncbi:hypothetical protein J6590_102088 [Homalodisca vitripennis]|nr:hypothetical protein J6590_102088 [Homalodisca vitripennis]